MARAFFHLSARRSAGAETGVRVAGSAEFRPAGRLFLTVPEGSGTLRRSMNHLDRPDSGELDFDEFPFLIDDAKPGEGLQRVAGAEGILTLRGAEVYLEPRTKANSFSRLSLKDLWAGVIDRDELNVPQSPSLGHDSLRKRWSTSGTVSKSSILVAVSDSGGPTESWRVYRFEGQDVAAPSAIAESVGYAFEGGITRSASTPQPTFIGPPSGSGTSQSFDVHFTDLDGASNISFAGLLFNSTLNGTNACLIYFNGLWQLGLVNDANTSVDWFTANTFGSVSNSQCTVNAALSSIYKSGTALTLRVDITFKPAFGGTKAIYMYARDLEGNVADWQVKGYWTIPNAEVVPVVPEVSPSSGYGVDATFSTQYTAVTGISEISLTGLLVNSLNGVGACLIYFNGGDQIGLVNDTNTATTLVTLGSVNKVSNSQCTLNAQFSQVSRYSTGLSLSVSVSFKQSFGGIKNIYSFVRADSRESGWFQRATWPVPPNFGASRPRSIDPPSGAGNEQAFRIFYDKGEGEIAVAGLLINSSVNGRNGCVVYYIGGNQIGLVNDANTSTSYIHMGSASQVTNSQCTLRGTGSSTSSISVYFSLTVNIGFKPGFGGTKTTFGYIAFASGQSSAWEAVGSWSIIGDQLPPKPDTVSPYNGSGSASTFYAFFSSPIGASTITTAALLVNATLGGVNNCVVYYSGGNQFGLANDGNTNANFVVAGSSSSVSNSQCTLSGAGSSIELSGTKLILTLALTFKPAFNGPKSLFSYVASGNQNSGWQYMSSYTVQ